MRSRMLRVMVLVGCVLLTGCAESMHQVQGGLFGSVGGGYGYSQTEYYAPAPWYAGWWPWWGPEYYPGSYWGPGWWGGYGYYGGRYWARPSAPSYRPSGPSRIPPQFRKR